MATSRTCYMTFTNNLRGAITNVALTHTSGNINDTIATEIDALGQGETSYQQTIRYETGWWADFDYWNLSFTYDGKQYSTPNNNRCNIKYEDEGSVIACSINPDGPWWTAGNMYLDVPLNSGGCKFGVKAVS
jgi:hypothetical protein